MATQPSASLPPATHKHEHSSLHVILMPHAKIEADSPVQLILDCYAATSTPTFGTIEELGDTNSDLAKFHKIHALPEQYEDLVAELNALDDVDGAYIKPALQLPVRLPSGPPGM